MFSCVPDHAAAAIKACGVVLYPAIPSSHPLEAVQLRSKVNRLGLISLLSVRVLSLSCQGPVIVVSVWMVQGSEDHVIRGC